MTQSQRTRSYEVTRPNDPPSWAVDSTLYEIYVRGFTTEIGDQTVFDALIERLDYLDNLGVDTLWLTPILENDHAPHGYNITDFFSIAEDLGDRADYERFVDAAHQRDMRVLFDLVMNHSARAHPYFQAASDNPDSEYYDWYNWRDDGNPETYFGWEYIANWNFENIEVRSHLLDVVDMWMEVADGFRCDMAWAVSNNFWQELRERVKRIDPEFLLLDETIPYIADFHNGMFDIHFDTTLYFTLREIGKGSADASALHDAIEQRATVGFPPHASFMLYLENHDETRYIVECGEKAARAAAGALFTLPGVPMIYGGQEIGQQGRRDPLVWEAADETLHEYYTHLIELRNEIPALGVQGGYEPVTEIDDQTTVGYKRTGEDDTYLCILNFGSDSQTVTPPVSVDPYDHVSEEVAANDRGLVVDSACVYRCD